MPRLFPLALILLPLALGASVAVAQEPPAGPPGAMPQIREGGGMPPPGAMRMPAQREAQAPPQPRSRRDMASTAATDPRSVSDAIRRVQRSTRGQILGVEQVPFEGRNITRVKYMDDRGRVRYMDAPPEGGVRRVPRRADNGEQ